MRRFRKRAGLSQATLAQESGLSTEAVSLLERGLRTPRRTTMRMLAEAMQLGLDERRQWFAETAARVTPAPGIPRYADPLIGRDDVVRQIRGLLDTSTRLVTLTGPGGVGKTRVAEAAATEVTGDRLGVRWLSVTPGTTDTQLWLALDEALQQPADGHASGAETPDTSDPALLLVIDQADQLLATVAAMCDSLLAGADRLRVIVTSRQRLNVPGETQVEIKPLALPVLADDLSTLTLQDSPASRLFLARAFLPDRGAERETADASAPDAAAIAQICHRVDGVPLAIELAAARTTVLTLPELATALETSLQLLYTTDSEQEVGLRHVMIEGSYQQLTQAEQTMLARLSVFAHQFSHESVAALYGMDTPSPEIVATLSQLVAKSLARRADNEDGKATFTLLRVIREFAGERLDSHDDCFEIRRRYAHYFRDLAEGAGSRLHGRDQEQSALRLDAAAVNMRSALAWCLDHDHASALTIVGSLGHWWHLRGHYEEGRSWATTALERSPRSPAALRAPVLAVAGLLDLLCSDYDLAQAHVQEALDAYSAVQDKSGVGWTLALLGSVACERGEYTVAAQLHEQALVLANRACNQQAIAAQLCSLSRVACLRGNTARAQDLGQRAMDAASMVGDQQSMAWAMLNLGMAAHYGGDPANATFFLDHALELSQRIGYREGIAWTHNQLGLASRAAGDHRSAARHQADSLMELQRLGSRWRIASVLDEQAALAAATGDSRQATVLLGAADQLRREIGVPAPAVELASRQATLNAAHGHLGSRAASMAGLAHTA